MFDDDEWLESGGGGDGEGWEANGDVEDEGFERDPDLDGGLDEYGPDPRPMGVALAKEGEKGEAEGLDPIRWLLLVGGEEVGEVEGRSPKGEKEGWVPPAEEEEEGWEEDC